MQSEARKWICACLLFPFLLQADFVPEPAPNLPAPESEGPWLTGPLLTGSPLVVPGGHYNVEPYFFALANTGTYDENWQMEETPTLWSNSFQPVIQVGLTSWMDIQVYPILFYNYTKGAGSWEFGDFPVQADFQLYQAPDEAAAWIPHLKFWLREIFPTGKYDELNPAKLGTDLGGGGSYVTTAGVVLGRVVHIQGLHFLSWRLSLQYNFPSSVHLKGLDAYGGGVNTDVNYLPAQSAEVYLGLEWTMTQRLALALDGALIWARGDGFSGQLGLAANAATPAAIGFGDPSFQYSLAPAIEYNWSENFGAILGSWFTVAGKNAVAFSSVVGAVNLYF